jgi:hypothetical protein
MVQLTRESPYTICKPERRSSGLHFQGVGISPSFLLFEASFLIKHALSVLLTRPEFANQVHSGRTSRQGWLLRYGTQSQAFSTTLVILHTSFNRPSSLHMYSVSCSHFTASTSSLRSRNNLTVSRNPSAGQSTIFGDFCLLTQCGWEGSTDHQQRFTATRRAHACSCMR